MLMMKSKESIAQVYVWCADSTLPENDENLRKIRQWWSLLNGKTIIWEVFSGDLNSTTVMYRDIVIVEDASLIGRVLRWRKRGLNNGNTLAVQHLVLDDSFQHLDIIPNAQHWSGAKYRVQVVD